MISIFCDMCKRLVGIIEGDALVCRTGEHYGIEIFCNECKHKEK